ncbi:extensin family protein [Nitratireductor sp. GCM10026969]|uniref:extensin-like domain-containing protein n=1 Tax=Nitratireductor sp. GCM10026969 TaxID=3252645 RepID=UPI003610EF4E
MRLILTSSVLHVVRLSVASMALMAFDVELPDQAPIPAWREEALHSESDGPIPSPEKACRKNLRDLGVAFTAVPPLKGANGCAVPFPLKVTTLAPDIDLQPPAVINCRTARAAARLFQNAGMAAAERHFDARISAVNQASGYVCRRINGSKNISQHAFGNALDVAAIVLTEGRTVNIQKHDAGSAEAKFQKEIRNAACGIFTTVLGPGTNADHGDHFHFDMKRRRSPYCR